MRHHGSCHCGKIRFEFEGTIDGAVTCNYSICSRKGAVLWAGPEADFRLLTSADGISAYTFNNHAIIHRFCKACGMQPYAKRTQRIRSKEVSIGRDGYRRRHQPCW
jgi:hypothetical protein